MVGVGVGVVVGGWLVQPLNNTIPVRDRAKSMMIQFLFITNLLS
jgi:hypothetical protein